MKATIAKAQLRRTFLALIVAFLLIALLLGWEVLALRGALQWVDHTDEVISSDRELLRLTVDMETGLRGFLVTRDESFLKPYEEARVLIGPRFSALDQLVADNASQGRRLAEMRSSYADWIRRSDPGAIGTLRPAEFFQENSSAGVQIRLKAAMDRIRAQHLAFAAIEEGLRNQRLAVARRGEALIDVLLLLVSLLGGAAAVLAMKQTGVAALNHASAPAPLQDRDWKAPLAEPRRKFKFKSWMRSASLVAGLPLIAVLLSIPLRPFSPYPFVLFYAAVSLVAWTEGMWLGFLSLALSLALADYFLIPPYGTFAVGFENAIGLVLCCCIQVLICWLIDLKKQAASILREQACLLDVSHDCIMVREMGGVIRFWNHGAVEMYGFSKEEACGRTSHDLLRTVFPRPLAEIEAELLQNGRWEGELQHTTHDGTCVIVDSRWVLQQAGNGAAPRLMEINNDITERSRQQKALHKSEAFLEQIGRLAGVGGWEIDLETEEVSWTTETYRILGADPSHRPTLQDSIALPKPEFRPAIAAAIEQSAADGRGWDLELVLNRFDGRPIWVRSVGSVENANGKPVRRVGAFQDMTVRILERQALQEANERANLATESCGIGIWDIDLRTSMVKYDSFMYRLYGLAPDCGVQADVEFWMNHVHVGDRAAVALAIQEAISGVRQFATEFRIVWDDASIHHIKATGVVTRDRDGNAVRMVGTNMDITASKHAEAALLRNTHALMRSNKELDEFAYAASHDLKAPLRVIDNASKWLEEDLAPHLSGETRENMSLLRSRVARMEKLLDDLLEYSRIGKTRSGRQTEILTGDKLMENVLGLVSLPPGFTVTLSPALAAIEVKRMPLQQILTNLIGNAVKHHDKKGGRIEVSVDDAGAWLVFKVRDDGPGIAPQFHERIFKMFQTLKPRDQLEGSGMGLAMVRKHVEFSGGTITVESAEGEGSIFCFTWPKQQQIVEDAI